jgi:hypothetical protein
MKFRVNVEKIGRNEWIRVALHTKGKKMPLEGGIDVSLKGMKTILKMAEHLNSVKEKK